MMPFMPNRPKSLPKSLTAYSPLSGAVPPRFETAPTPPSCIANPMSQYASMPAPYTMKFIIMVWLAFFARHKPVSTRANPACMNITRKPATRVQTKLMAIVFWPIWFTTSASVRPFFMSPTGMSATLPVIVPPGSPFALSSAFGPDNPLMSASVIMAGADAATGGAAAGGAAGWACVAGAWAWAVPDSPKHQVRAKASNTFFMCVSSKQVGVRLLLPDRILHIGLVQNTHDADQTDHDANEHDAKPHLVAVGDPEAPDRDQK